MATTIDLRYYEEMFTAGLKPQVKSIKFIKKPDSHGIFWEVENKDGDVFHVAVCVSRKYKRLEVRKRVAEKRARWEKHIIEKYFVADELSKELRQKVLSKLQSLLEGPATASVSGGTGAKANMSQYQEYFTAGLKPQVKSIKLIKKPWARELCWEVENKDGDVFWLGVLISKKYTRLETRKKVARSNVRWRKHIIEENFVADELSNELKQKVLAKLQSLLKGPATASVSGGTGAKANLESYMDYFTSELKPLVKNIEINRQSGRQIIWEIQNMEGDIFHLGVRANRNKKLDVRKRVAKDGAWYKKYPIRENFELEELDEALQSEILDRLKKLVD